MRHVRLHASRDNNNVAGSPIRITAACDSCATLKARCSEQKPCELCQSLHVSCTITHQTKRRGQAVQQQDQNPMVAQNTTTAYVQARRN